MKYFTKLKFAAVLALMVAVPFVAGAYTERAYAKDQNNQSKDQKQEVKKEDTKKATEAAYKYTAQPGDNYSLMARKAIQTYGLNNKINLSPAQIIYAETMLTQGAGSPELTEGQSIIIKQDAVKSWIEKAQKLSKEDEKAWAEYTQGVDFSTDKVGQPRS